MPNFMYYCGFAQGSFFDLFGVGGNREDREFMQRIYFSLVFF